MPTVGLLYPGFGAEDDFPRLEQRLGTALRPPLVHTSVVPDTAMHSLEWVDRLESAVGLPVLTANQVTVWQGLNLLGEVPSYDTLGTLFRTTSGD